MNLRVTLVIILAMLSVVSGYSQGVPAKGSATTFDIATWNIEWFGATNGPTDDELQIANVLDVFRNSNIDLWALQEIADDTDFFRILDSLGTSYNGFLATQSSGSQRIGYLYNTDVVRLISQMHILTSFSSDFASRPPLQMRAEVSIGDSSQVVTFITVHMKAFSDIDSYNKRLAASGRLKNHIDFTTLANERVIILGDFNDELQSSITFGQDSPYDNFLQDTDDYFFATLEMEQDGRNSWCSNFQCTSGSTIDHILLTDEMLPFLVATSPDHFDELLDAIPSYSNTTSDHLPVFARFDLNRVSSVADDSPTPAEGFETYPNPFYDSVTIHRSGVANREAVMSVFSVAGQLVQETNIGFDTERVVDLSAQPAGVYLVQLRTDNRVSMRRIVKL